MEGSEQAFINYEHVVEMEGSEQAFMGDIEMCQEANTSTNASGGNAVADSMMKSLSSSTNASGGHAVADSMMKSLADVVSKPRRGDPATIYKVPRRIRQVNESAYEPQILSIGPYHHGKKRLQGMEENKWWYLQSFLSRNPNHQLKDYVKAIEELEDKARNCYSDNVGPQMGNEFVEMMVLDGCFIVELFLKLNQVKEIQKEMEKVVDVCLNDKLGELCKLDPMFGTTWMLLLTGYDLLLLENQIPFFILLRIFQMASPVDGSLTELALDFFKDFLQRNEEIPLMDSYHHLLHLLHSHVIPSEESIPRNSNKWKKLLMFLRSRGFFPSSNEPQLPISNNPSPPLAPKIIPCAADLHLAGVKFKKKEKYRSILDVKFSNGVLEIPPLAIDDYTNTLFRNLIAFEQCYPDAKIRFTTYLSFMDCLIDMSKDVALLHRNRIIDHLLGKDEDVANLFNQLRVGTIDSYDDNYLSNLYKDVETHYNTRWNKWWASLRRDYFTNPWSGLSSIAAVILILVTITQTFFTVFPYYRPYGPGS